MLLILAILAFPTSTPAAKPDPLAARVAALEAQNKELAEHIDAEFMLVYDHLNYLKQHLEVLEVYVVQMQQPIVLDRDSGPQLAEVAPR